MIGAEVLSEHSLQRLTLLEAQIMGLDNPWMRRGGEEEEEGGGRRGRGGGGGGGKEEGTQ